MNLALDTNRYSDFARGDADAVATIASASLVCMPVIVLGELRAGFRRGRQEAKNEAALKLFLSRPEVSILQVDEATSAVYGKLEAELRSRGTPIPTNDVWIAALAIQRGLPLYTRDPHFAHLPQVMVV